MIVEYQLVARDNSLKLQDMVNLFIKEGWRPQGGVTVSYGRIGSMWAQALVREDGGLE